MKVKVSYTMEYENVPHLVSELAEGCMRRLREHGKTQLNYRNLERLAEEVSKVQSDLSLINDQLGDCLAILAGYEHAKNPPADDGTSVLPEGIFAPEEGQIDEQN